MPGARSTRSLAWKMKKPHEQSHHRYAATSRHSLHDGFTAYSVLSPVTGLSCHRRLQVTTCKLDASVGAPGPHSFAVRGSAVRLAGTSRPSHPAPNVRDDREAPLLIGGGTREMMVVIWGVGQVRWLAALWHDGQFAHGGHAVAAKPFIPPICAEGQQVTLHRPFAVPAFAIPRQRPQRLRAPAAAGAGSGNTETVLETARTSHRAR